MEKRAGDANGAVGGLERLVGIKAAAEGVFTLSDPRHRGFKRIDGQAALPCQFGDRVRRQDGALRLGVLEIGELARDPSDTFVENSPGDAFGLGQHGARSLGIALHFVPEAFALYIHLNAAFGDDGPRNQDAMGVRHVAMTLVGAQMVRGCAKRFAPADRVAAIAGMAEIDRILDLGHVAAHHLAIAAKAVARKDKGVAADLFARPVRQDRGDTHDLTVLGSVQVFDAPLRDDGNAFCLQCGTQPVDQFTACARGQAMHAPP